MHAFKAAAFAPPAAELHSRRRSNCQASISSCAASGERCRRPQSWQSCRRAAPAANRAHGHSFAALAHATSYSEAPQAHAPLAVEDLPQGRLVIRLLEESDVGAASVVLTRGFAASADLTDGRGYCQGVLMQVPDGVMLIVRLYPEDRTLLRRGQDSRLVATASLSFSCDTREEFPSLQPPDAAAYLCNMAVDPSFRRQGHARRMLAAAEGLAARRGVAEVYLHARLADAPALALYASSGYEEVDRDSWLLKLRGLTPRALMRKRVPAARL